MEVISTNEGDEVYDFGKREPAVNSFRPQFHGDGFQFFGIVLVNIVFTFFSLGLYYPWARAKTLQYLYGETEFAGSRFTFHGTGKEMFKGFIKAIAIIVALVMIGNLGAFTGSQTLAIIGGLVYAIGIMLLIPIAIHGGLRYRMSRTSWRGIHFGYRGKLAELFNICLKGFLLSIVTLGIYSSWFVVDLRKYIQRHLRMGNCELEFTGSGGELFWINFKGIVLSILTLGIYSFWYVKNLNNFYVNHTALYQEGRRCTFHSSLTAGDVFVIGITNYFLVLFTLGLGLPWAMLRQMRMVINNIEMQGAFVPETVVQTEEDYADATGEDLLDMLDLGLDF